MEDLIKILVVGDSISFSRIHKGQKLEESWPALVQEHSERKCVLWNRSHGGWSCREIKEELAHLSVYLGEVTQFDYLVLQYGIVDCCPRDLTNEDTVFLMRLARIPFVGKYFKFWIEMAIKYLRKRFSMRKANVNKCEFRKITNEIFSLGLKLSKFIIFIEIAPPFHYFISNEPDISLYISEYNEASGKEKNKFNTEKIVSIDWEECCDSYFLEDGHHLSGKGHAFLANKVIDCMANLSR